VLFEGRDAAAAPSSNHLARQSARLPRGVEYVMGFSSRADHRRFLLLYPQMEKYAVEGGIVLIKQWLEVGQQEQEQRSGAPIDDPLRQWKPSPMDIKILAARYDHSEAHDLMRRATIRSMHHGISSPLTTSEEFVSTAFRTFWNTFPTSVYHAALSNCLRGPKGPVR
jgi:Polyphosphate kinase 2 (PPK2)